MDRPLDRLAFYDKPEKCNPQTRERLKATIINHVKSSGKDTDIIKLRVFHVYTVCILNFEPYPQQFKDMYKNAIIDLDMKDDLERSNVINWCRTTKQLYPLKTTADGNCLLHAVSLGLWGIEDSDQFLRRLLYLNITTDGRGMFKKRWLAYQRQSLNSNRFNVRMNTEEYSVEWESVIKATIDVMRQENHGLPYTTLESIHLYILANILCRPIIVLADRVARNVYGQSLQESEIGGIYLPLESRPLNCHKTPIVIGYNMNHFAPLVFEESDISLSSSLHSVPLVTSDLNSLPVHYLLLDEEPQAQALLTNYLTVNEIVYTASDGPITIPAVLVKHEPLSREVNIMEAYRLDCEHVYRNITGHDVSQNVQHFNFERRNRNVPLAGTQNMDEVTQVNIMPSNAVNIVQGAVTIGNVPQPQPAAGKRECLAMGCKMYGTAETGWFCSKCFKKGTKQYHRQEEAARRSREQQRQVNNPGQMNGQQRQHHVATTVRQHTEYQDISIMGADCQAGCGFKCSTETYPYCHECHPKYTQVVAPPARPQNIAPPARPQNIAPPVRPQNTAPPVRPVNMDQQEVQLSMLPDSCITENCMYRCSSATKPYCHQCYEKVSQIQRNTDPSAPPQSIQNGVAGSNEGLLQHPAQSPLNYIPQNRIGGEVLLPPNVQAGNMHSPIVPMDTSTAGRLGSMEGVLPKQCRMTGCTNQAIKGNNGMCESCYNMSLFGPGLGVSPPPAGNNLIGILQHIDDIPRQEKSCTSPGCTEKVEPGIDQCMPCFLKIGSMPSSREHTKVGQMPMNIIAPEDEKILNSNEKLSMPRQPSENQFGQANIPSAIELQTEKQEGYQQKQFCVTEGCSGLHLNNEFGLCDVCYTKLGARSDLESSGAYPSCTPVELSEKEVKQLNPVVVSSRQKTKCNSPFCDEMIYPPKAYCEDCMSALQETRAKKSIEAEKKKNSTNPNSCRTPGCKFSGSPEFNGFCSQCFKSKTTEPAKIPNGTNNTFPLRIGKGLGERQHATAPITEKSDRFSQKLCVVPNCKRFGDPSQLDRCSQHYQQALNTYPPEQVGQTVSLHRAHLHTGTQQNPLLPPTNVVGANNYMVDPFVQSISKVEGDRKSRNVCNNNLVTGCQNYGNAKSKGFCNSCYPEIRRKEFARELAAAGGNRFG